MRLSKIIMIIGALSLLGLFLFPLWNISIIAPQYPDPIGMNIWIDGITDMNENDIKNINILNHYIGMQEIPTEMPEFRFFPPVIVIMTIIGLLVGFIGNHKFYLGWFVAMSVLGTIGMYDFYLWETEYGHNLSENAPLKLTDLEGNPMTYQPPLFGTKPLLNFTAMSYPRLGAYLLMLGMGLALLAYFRGKRKYLE